MVTFVLFWTSMLDSIIWQSSWTVFANMVIVFVFTGPIAECYLSSPSNKVDCLSMIWLSFWTSWLLPNLYQTSSNESDTAYFQANLGTLISNHSIKGLFNKHSANFANTFEIKIDICFTVVSKKDDVSSCFTWKSTHGLSLMPMFACSSHELGEHFDP